MPISSCPLLPTPLPPHPPWQLLLCPISLLILLLSKMLVKIMSLSKMLVEKGHGLVGGPLLLRVRPECPLEAARGQLVQEGPSVVSLRVGDEKEKVSQGGFSQVAAKPLTWTSMESGSGGPSEPTSRGSTWFLPIRPRSSRRARERLPLTAGSSSNGAPRRRRADQQADRTYLQAPAMAEVQPKPADGVVARGRHKPSMSTADPPQSRGSSANNARRAIGRVSCSATNIRPTRLRTRTAAE